MVEGAQSCFTSLAADRESAARPQATFRPLLDHRPHPTFTQLLPHWPKTRVWGFSGTPSGRLSRRRRGRSMFTPGSRACAYKTASGLGKWPNRDPLDEPGFETLHLVSQPLFIRKLRLNINDSEMQYFLAMAIQSGSINMADYLRNAHTPYAGDSISTLTFFNILLSGQGNYAPNWPVELLEYPNLFDFVGNDPLDGIDPNGLLWGWVQSIVNWFNTPPNPKPHFTCGPWGGNDPWGSYGKPIYGVQIGYQF